MSTTVTQENKGEIFYEANANNAVGNSSVHFIFPPPSIYNNAGENLFEYTRKAGDKIVNKDVAFLKFDIYTIPLAPDTGYLGGTQYEDGDFGYTNIAGAFYSNDDDDYFFKYTGADSTQTAPALARGAVTPEIEEAIHLPSNSEGGTFTSRSNQMKSSNVNRFDDIEVGGLDEGDKPLGQQMFALRLGDADIEDVTYKCFAATPVTTTIDEDITNATDITAGAAHFSGITNARLVEPDNAFVHEQGATENTDYVSAVEIVNVEREQDDLRYGDEEDDYPFMFTGAMYVFDDTELTTVEAGSELLINNIDVHGGDCFIGTHTFKISDSCYALTDPEKEADGAGTILTASPYTPTDLTDRWGHYFDKVAGQETVAGEDVSRPYPVRGVSQTISVVLESEINPNLAEKSPHTGYSDSVAPVKIPVAEEGGHIRSKFKYRYSLDYSKQNDAKIWLPFKTIDSERTLFGARLTYSDQKIYQTDQEGFDRFRVSNIEDLDETAGNLMRLELAKDNLYGFQEKSIVYIPILAQNVELTDVSTLAVRSGEVIGHPVYISSVLGTQYPKTVISDGEKIYFADHRNNQIGLVSGQDIKIISDIGMKSYFQENMGTPTLDSYAVYDRERNEYIYIDRETLAVVFNTDLGVWTSRQMENGNSISIKGGLWSNGVLYKVGGDVEADDDIKLWDSRSSSANYGLNLNVTAQPTVEVQINPEVDLPKTFDVLAFNATKPLSSVSFTVVTPEITLTDSIVLSSLTTREEGLYKLKELRNNADNARFRGLIARANIYLRANQTTQTVLSSLLTKYRPSHKQI